MNTTEVVILAIVTIFIFVSIFGFLAYLRYLQYRETIELAKQGIRDKNQERRNNSRNYRTFGVVVTALGVAFTLGLLPIVIADGLESGPILLAGLIPMTIGVALLYLVRLERDDPFLPDEVDDDDDDMSIPPHKI
ncbi:DUF6249 domain-containing protein [Candidatus Leptofilum sp.]|uniref:DUF6249 domain-containing protein n=1 Tax=Candidatus Leptofilum sp. TaxID=3241576 RepID=UPI003B59775D